MLGDVLFATGAQNPPSASLTRQSRFDPRSPQAAGHFLILSLTALLSAALAAASLTGPAARHVAIRKLRLGTLSERQASGR